jgi:hypothetical protein
MKYDELSAKIDAGTVTRADVDTYLAAVSSAAEASVETQLIAKIERDAAGRFAVSRGRTRIANALAVQRRPTRAR